MSHYVEQWNAVFWDIGGVILDTASVREIHRDFVGWLLDATDTEIDVDTGVEQWRTALGDHFREREGTEFRKAKDGYARAVNELVGEPVPESDWYPVFIETLDQGIRPNTGVPETIEALAEIPIHQGVISDVDTEEGRRIVNRFDLLDHFDSFTTSESVGRTKPDAQMFQSALESADATPARSLMIGDRYTHDMCGAADVGMHTAGFGGISGPAVEFELDQPSDIIDIIDSCEPTPR